MHEGHVKIYRRLKKSPYYRDSQYVHLWLHLLLEVNHSPHRVKLKGSDTFIELQPGQVLTSRDKLSEQTGIHSSKVNRVLKAFEIEQQIEQQTFTKFRIITIINWLSYQKREQQNEQQMNNKRTTDEQQMNTNKNVKNEKNNIPTLDEVILYCQERGNRVDPQKWFDFYQAKGWLIGKNKMKDWKAAVRTWEKNDTATEFHPPKRYV